MIQKNSKIKDPNVKYPVEFESTNACYKGTIWIAKEGLHYKVIEYHNKYDVEILCLELGNVAHVYLASLRRGAIKNPYLKNRYGGYFGEGPYTKHGNIKAYSTWYKILYRLVEENQVGNSRNAAYAGVTVAEEWLNFQVFADWFEKYISELNPEFYTQYQIDKDILTWDTPVKIYSPQTCCLIPEQINLACSNYGRERVVEDLPVGVHANSSGKGSTYIINMSMYGEAPYFGTFKTPEEAFKVYKFNKEKYLKELADYYYQRNAIKVEVYNALYNIDIKPYPNKTI